MISRWAVVWPWFMPHCYARGTLTPHPCYSNPPSTRTPSPTHSPRPGILMESDTVIVAARPGLAQMRVSLLPRLIATFSGGRGVGGEVVGGGVKLREKRSEASGHLLPSSLPPNYLSSQRGMKTDKAGPQAAGGGGGSGSMHRRGGGWNQKKRYTWMSWKVRLELRET